jgi:hypothetical protein
MTAASVTPIKPVSLTLIGPGHTIFQEFAVHIRDGYVPHPTIPVEFFQNGNVSIMCVLGNPTQHAIDKARESNELAVAQQEADFNKAVEAEARRQREEEKRAELEKQKARIKAEHEKAIRALEAATEAEVAKLNAATEAQVAKLK